MNDSVTVEIGAPASTVWSLISDVTRIGEFSPETFEAEWLDGATGPATGARFRGHVRRNGRGPTYWTTCRVTECEPERRFAFDVLIRDKPANSWSFSIEPGAVGVALTESFSLAPTAVNRVYWRIAGRRRGATNREGMRTTLKRIKARAEASG